MSYIIDKSILLSYIKKCIDNNSLELECVFNSRIIDKPTFLRVLDSLKSINNFNYENHSLDIRLENRNKLSDIRISVNGLENIKQYCKTESLENIDNVSFMDKKFYEENSPDGLTDVVFKSNNDEFDYRLNVKSENMIDRNNPMIDELLQDFKHKFKQYRYKKRYSFISYDKLFRFDLTVLKSSYPKKKAKSFKEANILNNKEFYEIEIEYIGSNVKEDGKREIEILYEKLEKGEDYITPYNLYLKKSPNPIGLVSSIDMEFKDEPSKKIKKYDPEVSLTTLESVFKETKEKNKDELLKELDDNILMYKELIQEAGDDPELIIMYQETIDNYESEKKELLDIKGGAKKLPKWAQETLPEFAILDYELLSDKIYDYYSEHISYMLTLIYNTNYLLGKSQRIYILQQFKELTKQKTSLENVRLNIPQPITLSKEFVNPNNPDSIFLKYAVTEKADGERYILYILDNRGILINSKKHVLDTGIEFPDLNKNYVFDGEYITKNIDGENIKLFMIFDIYYEYIEDKVKYHHKKPFYDETEMCRHKLLLDFKQNVLKNLSFDNSKIEIDVKNYEFGKSGSTNKIGSDKYLRDCSTILKKCNNILVKSDNNSFRYNIDGLIFIPLFNAVKSNNSVDKPDYIGGKWERNFKWKPPEENTIDFQVKFIRDSKNRIKEFPYTITNEDGSTYLSKYKQLQLFVSYDKMQDSKIDFCMRILDDSLEEKGKKILFSPDDDKILYTTNVPVDFDTKKVICERDKLEIKDNDIVEMLYVKDEKNRMIWKPLRIRTDKMEPQFFTVANNVWSTIQNPVSSDFIRNNVDLMEYKVDMDKDISNKYYVSEVYNPITEPLRKLHNYIKSKLITGVCSSFRHGISILDLSIGRGGDLNKYLARDSNAKFIMGMDLSTQVEDCCERYFKQRKDKPPGVFLIGNTSQNISSGDCFNGIEGDDVDSKISHSRNMLNILYNLRQPVPKQYKNIQKKYNGLAKRGNLPGFDVISSQFSLHYYFETRETFEGFMSNLLNNIAPNGYFIGTCYDGMRVFNTIKDESLSYGDDEGNLIYSIQKMYETESFDFDEKNTDNMFGQRIDVFMESIGQTLSEYLVNFDFLKYYMEKKGFSLVNVLPLVKNRYKNLFRDTHITNGFGDFGKVINRLSELEDGDRDLQKGGFYEGAMDIVKNTTYNKDKTIKTKGSEELRLISSLNNFFVFKRT